MASSVLPQNPFDNQEFLDFSNVLWIYNEQTNCWRRIGKIKIVPLASSVSPGLLSKEYKFLLDNIPEKGGGFAIVTRPHLTRRNADNPDGVIFGDIELTSDSLDIQCVFSDGSPIRPGCTSAAFKETDILPPGFDINFSEKLLNTLCIEVPGGPGPRGDKGDKGLSGKDGTGDGPKGLKGEPGIDATEHHKLTGIKILDIDDIFDTAVVKLDIDQQAGKLFVTKAKINIPTEEDAAVEQFIVAQISRDIKFTECLKYDLITSPCRPDDDFTEPNPTIAYFPSHFDPANLNERTFQPVRRQLSDLVNDVVGFYQNKLDEFNEKYNDDIDKFIKDKDAEARKQLDVLGDRLAECENITYLEYCLAPLACEDNSPGQVVNLPASRPDCAALGAAIHCPDTSDCQILDNPIILANVNPVISIKAPLLPVFPPKGSGGTTITICPRGCWISSGSAHAWLPPGGMVPPGWKITNTPGGNAVTSPPDGPIIETTGCNDVSCQQFDKVYRDYIDRFRAALSSATVQYKKTQLKSGPSSFEFSPGTYAFVYVGGSFRQDHLSHQQLYGKKASDLIGGKFNEYWVGNENGGGSVGPYFIIAPDGNGHVTKVPFNSVLTSTETGLEIGFAPINYVNRIPPDYFSKHVFDVNSESGTAGIEVPFPRIDFNGEIESIALLEESKIQWKKFPTIRETSDPALLQNAYLNGLVNNKAILFTTTVPGLFYARVKVAYSVLNPLSQFIMPPVKQIGSRQVSVNKNTIELVSGNAAVVDARPLANGQVGLQVVKVNCVSQPKPPVAPPVTQPPSFACSVLKETKIPNKQVWRNGDIFHSQYEVIDEQFDAGALRSAVIGMSKTDFDKLLNIGLFWLAGPLLTLQGKPAVLSAPLFIDGNRLEQYIISGALKGLKSGEVVTWTINVMTRGNNGTGDWRTDNCTFSLTGA